MDAQLLNQAERVHQRVKRNVMDMPETKDVIGQSSPIFEKAIKRAEQYISPHSPGDNFYYTTAIEYPFKTEPFMFTRYSNGTYPVWYGSRTVQTTVYETLYHAVKHLKAIEGVDRELPIVRRRSIYAVFCDTVLISVLGKEKQFPQLIEDDYHFTQGLGNYLKTKHYSGLISPSARDKNGINYNIFQQQVLSAPKREQQLRYQIDVGADVAQIYQGIERLMQVAF